MSTTGNDNAKSHQCPTPAGVLLIIGGKENKEIPSQQASENDDNPVGTEILQTFVDLTGKKDPIIEVITSASTEGDEAFEDYKKVFNNMGIQNVKHMHHRQRKEVLEDKCEDRISEADAFFFSGGDQLLLTSIYGGTWLLTELKKRYINDNIVIGGTSAGAAALSTPMIYAGNNEVQQIAGEIKVTTGLEFVKDVCIDTHFVHRGRFVRLAQVIATNPTSIGIGIEENTAIILRNGREAEIIGTGTTIIFEGFDITYTNVDEFDSNRPISIRDLKMHILSKGNKYTIEDRNPPHQ